MVTPLTDKLNRSLEKAPEEWREGFEFYKSPLERMEMYTDPNGDRFFNIYVPMHGPFPDNEHAYAFSLMEALTKRYNGLNDNAVVKAQRDIARGRFADNKPYVRLYTSILNHWRETQVSVQFTDVGVLADQAI